MRNVRNEHFFLTLVDQPVDPNDTSFWDQFWNETSLQSMSDVFTLIPGAEVRALREEIPTNLASLCYKAVEKLVKAAESSSLSTAEEQHIGEEFDTNILRAFKGHCRSCKNIATCRVVDCHEQCLQIQSDKTQQVTSYDFLKFYSVQVL